MRDFFERLWTDWNFAKMVFAPAVGLIMAILIAYGDRGNLTWAVAAQVTAQWLFSVYGGIGGLKADPPGRASSKDPALPLEIPSVPKDKS